MPGEANIMRVYARGKDGPGLAVSRSIGDEVAHQLGVTERPDIQVVKLDHKRMSYTMVVASDGLWNIFGPNMVLKHLNSLMNGALEPEQDSPEMAIQEGKRRKIQIAMGGSHNNNGGSASDMPDYQGKGMDPF